MCLGERDLPRPRTVKAPHRPRCCMPFDPLRKPQGRLPLGAPVNGVVVVRPAVARVVNLPGGR